MCCRLRACVRSVLAIVLCGVLLAGCGTSTKRWSGPRGTRPYTVNGKTYYPLASARGFSEEGMASWYGPGFHGKTTASGERFNQNAMTAAHTILPLGAKVRVTHCGNGRSVVVRVNDRGPFTEKRVIDLSRAAAETLRMLGTGTARVRIRSLDMDAPAPSTIPVPPAAAMPAGSYYVQIGAFADKGNAATIITQLTQGGHRGRLLYGDNNMWNVQVGPWQTRQGAQENLPLLRLLYPGAFVVGDE